MAGVVMEMELTDGGDSTKLDEEDSGAVVAPHLLLVRVTGRLLELLPVLRHFLPWVCVFHCVFLFYNREDGFGAWLRDGDSDNHLAILEQMMGIGTMPIISVALFSLRRVTMEETGQLKQLGVGAAFISSSGARRLHRWNLLLFSLAVGALVGGAVGGLRSLVAGNRFVPDEAKLMMRPVDLVHVPTVILGPCLMAWYLSLKEASVLVSDSVAEARKLIKQTSPTSPEWNDRVVPAILKLISHTLPALSTGWGDGLVAIWASLWFGALGSFVGFLASGELKRLLGILGGAMVPMLIAADVAAASSDCDSVRTALNDKRLETMEIEAHDQISIAEAALKHCNRDQVRRLLLQRLAPFKRPH